MHEPYKANQCHIIIWLANDKNDRRIDIKGTFFTSELRTLNLNLNFKDNKHNVPCAIDKNLIEIKHIVLLRAKKNKDIGMDFLKSSHPLFSKDYHYHFISAKVTDEDHPLYGTTFVDNSLPTDGIVLSRLVYYGLILLVLSIMVGLFKMLLSFYQHKKFIMMIYYGIFFIASGVYLATIGMISVV